MSLAGSLVMLESPRIINLPETLYFQSFALLFVFLCLVGLQTYESGSWGMFCMSVWFTCFMVALVILLGMICLCSLGDSVLGVTVEAGGTPSQDCTSSTVMSSTDVGDAGEDICGGRGEEHDSRSAGAAAYASSRESRQSSGESSPDVGSGVGGITSSSVNSSSSTPCVESVGLGGAGSVSVCVLKVRVMALLSFSCGAFVGE